MTQESGDLKKVHLTQIVVCAALECVSQGSMISPSSLGPPLHSWLYEQPLHLQVCQKARWKETGDRSWDFPNKVASCMRAFLMSETERASSQIGVSPAVLGRDCDPLLREGGRHEKREELPRLGCDSGIPKTSVTCLAKTVPGRA